MKADWCGFGAQEQVRQTQEIFKRAEARGGAAGQAVMDEANRTVGAELVRDAGDEAQRRWTRQLMQRGDARSQALADYITADDAANARLQARARSSSDPMVTALALRRPCAAGACVNIEASQWSRLEPANMEAWMAVLSERSGTAQIQAGYVVERLAAEAQYSRTYLRETLGMLLSLPRSEPIGLQSDAELQRLQSVFAGWAISPHLRPVMQVCREGQLQAGTSSRCEAIADMLWQQDDETSHSMALGFARAALPGRPDRRPVWDARAREVEALAQWRREQFERLMADDTRNDNPPTPCGAQEEVWQMLRKGRYELSWARARADMRAADADDAVLSAVWRKDEGRTMLDAPRFATPH